MLAQVQLESERTSQSVAGLNQIIDKIDIVQQAMSDWSIQVDQHHLQLKADVDVLKTEQQQKEQQMEQRFNQGFHIVTETSAGAVNQVRGDLDELKKGIGNEIQTRVCSAEYKFACMGVMGGRWHLILEGQGQR